MWWSKAAEHGNIQAMRNLVSGYSLIANDGTFQKWVWGYDPQKEKYWRMKAASTGDIDAQLDLAHYYDWTADDKMKAIEWYEKVRFASMDVGKYDILFEVYTRLADIYEYIDKTKQYYDINKEKEMCIRVLRFREEHNDYFVEDYQDVYKSKASTLARIFEYCDKDYKKAAYCYVLSYYTGNECAKESVQRLVHIISDSEFESWKSDAKALRCRITI